MKVGDIYIALGIRKDASFNQASGWINGIGKLALGVAGYFGFKGIGAAMFGFNSMLETSKNQVAEMLAIAHKSSFAKEIGDASKAVDDLNEKATKLPGSTEEYLQIFKQVAGPIASAGGNLQNMEDITIATALTAKMVGRDWATAAREIERGISGTSRVTDRTLIKLLEMAGTTMKQFKAMTKQQREHVLETAANSKYIKEYADVQAGSFAGQVEQLGDRIRKFFARVGESLFKSVGGGISNINDWLEKHKKRVTEIADAIGGFLANVAEKIGSVFEFLISGTDEAEAVLVGILVFVGLWALQMAAAWIIAMAPILIFIGVIAALYYALKKLFGSDDDVAAIGDGFDESNKKSKSFVDQINDLPNQIEKGLTAVADLIMEKLGAAWDFVKQKTAEAIDTFTNNPLTKLALGFAGGQGAVELMDKERDAARQTGRLNTAHVDESTAAMMGINDARLMNVPLGPNGQRQDVNKNVTVNQTTNNTFNLKDAMDLKDAKDAATENSWDRNIRHATAALVGL